jgi:hypothetical protein
MAHECLYASDSYLIKLLDKRERYVIADPSCSPISYNALVINRTKITSRGDISWSQVKSDTESG